MYDIRPTKKPTEFHVYVNDVHVITIKKPRGYCKPTWQYFCVNGIFRACEWRDDMTLGLRDAFASLERYPNGHADIMRETGIDEYGRSPAMIAAGVPQ